MENEEATDPVSDAIEETDPAVAAGEEADLVSDIITSDGLIAEEAGTGNANAAMPIDAILVDGIEKEMENEAGNLYRATVLLDRADMVAAGEAIPEDTLGLLPRHEIALQTPNMPFYLAADWTFVPDYESCRANFSRAGIPAFSLFQNLDGNYRRNKTGEIIYLPLTEETAQPEENTPPANDSQSEAEEAPSLVTDLTDLAKITDLTARVASYYMRAL